MEKVSLTPSGSIEVHNYLIKQLKLFCLQIGHIPQGRARLEAVILSLFELNQGEPVLWRRF